MKNPNFIGEGQYIIRYDVKQGGFVYDFEGVCENFCGTGKCVFWNEEKEQMLVVPYGQIISIIPTDKN